jgi:rhamnopyranosyl-N-acetylglucosaminyl-diphospho-decaprenol beta-1,3/1,4-galactofuranosyltransferase
MNAKLNSVGAVIVTFNRRHLLEQVLDSLLAQTRPVDHIYIIDNASTDGTAEYLSTLSNPKISCRCLSTNTGGAGGFSYGMKWAFDEGHEWIWLMDDDITHNVRCLEFLLGARADARILLPLTTSDDGRTLTGVAIRMNLNSPFTMGFRLPNVNVGYPLIKDLPELLQIEDLCFEGPLIHRSVPESIGFPRADFFISCDDTEYGIRALRSKLGPILLIRDAVMKRSANQFSLYPLWRMYYQWRNELIIRSSRWAHPLMRIRVRTMFLLRTIFGCVSRKDSLATTRVRIHAFIDSLPGRPLINRYLPA